MKKKIVSVVMGSDSDLAVMDEAIKILQEFKIGFEVIITSAHRSPRRTSLYAQRASNRGIEVIIAGAGHSAHLAGVIASHTTLPVIGVPMESKLDGLDSLLSTVQMPSGIPVATVAVGKAGAINAAILAAEIIGLSNKAIDKKLADHKRELVKKVEKKNKSLKHG